jgi:hypothetical protein
VQLPSGTVVRENDSIKLYAANGSSTDVSGIATIQFLINRYTPFHATLLI